MPIASFVFIPTETPSTDATGWHKALPREMRKTLRLHKPASASRNAQTHDGVDSYLRTEYRTDSRFTQNLEFLDRGFDYDEFDDIDNEFDGLTITEPMDDVQMFHFCTGYDVI